MSGLSACVWRKHKLTSRSCTCSKAKCFDNEGRMTGTQTGIRGRVEWVIRAATAANSLGPRRTALVISERAMTMTLQLLAAPEKDRRQHRAGKEQTRPRNLLFYFISSCVLAALGEIRLIAAFRPYNPTYLQVGRFLRANFAPLFLFCWKIVSYLSDFVGYRWSYRDADNGQGN